MGTARFNTWAPSFTRPRAWLKQVALHAHGSEAWQAERVRALCSPNLCQEWEAFTGCLTNAKMRKLNLKLCGCLDEAEECWKRDQPIAETL
jgi:hypothetical protein